MTSVLRLAATLVALTLATECRAQLLDHNKYRVKTTLWDGDDLPDLVLVKKTHPLRHPSEIHIFSGASHFRKPLVEVGLPAAYADRGWEFVVADWDLDGHPDLWAIQRDGKGHRVEIHILAGALFFQDFLLHVVTDIPAAGPGVEFLAIPPIRDAPTRPNLMMVDREGTTSHHTEVRILDGGTKFQDVVLRAVTPFPETGTGPSWQFQAGDFNEDRVLDLIAITDHWGGAAYVVDGRSDLKKLAFSQQLTNDGANLKGRFPALENCEEGLYERLERTAADPLDPSDRGTRTPLMSGTTTAPALADFYSGVSVSQAIRRFQIAPADTEHLRLEPHDRRISTRLELVDEIRE